MRIPFFPAFVKKELKNIELKNCPLVFDAQNMQMSFYAKSGLPNAFGCESDKYAAYLRKQLSVYKNANIECYFIFKGGHENLERKEKKMQSNKQSNKPSDYNSNPFPCFIKDVFKNILDEMGFMYAVCEFESKREIIALAQKLNCPVVSYDIEFCFAGVPYIPINDITCDENNNALQCGVFVLNDFLEKYGLSKEHLATFILVTDIEIFPLNKFDNFLKSLHMLSNDKLIVIKNLLMWLSTTTSDEARKIIFKYLRNKDKIQFSRENVNLLEKICRQETPGLCVEYLMNRSHITFSEKDPLWLQKGIVSGNIPVSYINLYHWKKVFGSWCTEDPESEDSMFFSIDIISYAYNLLTNFKGGEIIFNNKHNLDIPITDLTSIPKPYKDVTDNVFENGWEDIESLKLFDYFLNKSLEMHNFNHLNILPQDAKMLIIALVYFVHRKVDDMTCEVISIILSYVMLGVVAEKSVSFNKIDKIATSLKPILDSTTDKHSVTENDCQTAKAVMQKYFEISESDISDIFDPKLVHPLVEFQHCIQQLNYLNRLCGLSYEPINFSKTYNGTFVYKVLYTIKKRYQGNAKVFMTTKLSCAATVLAFFNGIFEVFEDIMYR